MVNQGNTSGFLQSVGGGLQQSSNTQGSQSNLYTIANPLNQSGSTSGPSQQDLLGEGLAVGQVNFDSARDVASTPVNDNVAGVSDNNFFDPTSLVIIFVGVIAIAVIVRRFATAKAN